MLPEPGESSRVDGALCPSCERFIGPARSCRYCGEPGRPDPVLRFLRLGAVLLATLGLFFLLLMARTRAPAAVSIGDISPLMSFATVCVSGRVARTPYVSSDTGGVDYISFLVDDGTGSLRVAARGRVADSLARADRIPRRDSRVEVTGILRTESGGKFRLYLRSAEHVHWVAAAGTNGTTRGATPARGIGEG